MMLRTHALTIDLEDWHQLFYLRFKGESCGSTGNVVTDTQHILDLLAELNIHATFFVVGKVAASFPDVIRKVAKCGHEIGSHTYNHKVFCAMSPTEFKADVELSRKQLQDLSSQPVLGFRAPEFSVGGTSGPFFEVLTEAGFQYDSSVFPCNGVRYGIPEASTLPFSIRTLSGVIREYPIATWSMGHHRLPVGGGTYFRFLPVHFLHRVLADFSDNGRCGVFYFHPYEFHRGWLHLSKLTWRQSLQPTYAKYALLHNFFTSRIQNSLKSLLTEFRFQPLGEIYKKESSM